MLTHSAYYIPHSDLLNCMPHGAIACLIYHDIEPGTALTDAQRQDWFANELTVAKCDVTGKMTMRFKGHDTFYHNRVRMPYSQTLYGKTLTAKTIYEKNGYVVQVLRI